MTPGQMASQTRPEGGAGRRHSDRARLWPDAVPVKEWQRPRTQYGEVSWAGGARGFTLVELALVLFVVALVAGLALPTVGRGVDTLQLRADVAAFSAFLRYAREQAITRREAQEVRVNPDSHLLTLRAAGGDTRASRRLSPRIAISAESPIGLSITFSPRGLSSGGSFRLVGPDGQAYRVQVDPFTGRVTNVRGSS